MSETGESSRNFGITKKWLMSIFSACEEKDRIALQACSFNPDKCLTMTDKKFERLMHLAATLHPAVNDEASAWRLQRRMAAIAMYDAIQDSNDDVSSLTLLAIATYLNSCTSNGQES